MKPAILKKVQRERCCRERDRSAYLVYSIDLSSNALDQTVERGKRAISSLDWLASIPTHCWFAWVFCMVRLLRSYASLSHDSVRVRDDPGDASSSITELAATLTLSRCRAPLADRSTAYAQQTRAGVRADWHDRHLPVQFARSIGGSCGWVF